MLTEHELDQMRMAVLPENETKLLSEIDRLKIYIRDYGDKVSSKLDVLEKGRMALEEENARLISAKRIVYVERDACISLLAQLAVLNGMRAGIAPGNRVIVDLPSGQVSWEYHEAEAHLFAQLPEYPDSIEELDIQNKYSRVMNPGMNT